MTSEPLFIVSIPRQGRHVGGTITCTEMDPAVYLLTVDSPPDNRLTAGWCDAFLDALDALEFGGFARGVVVTTSAIAKFFSNGLDLEMAFATPTFLPEKLYRVFARVLTYPMPTVALVNGHAFAGGLMLAMHHDYRVMNGAKGFVCINELEFGVPLKPAMSSVFRLKLSPRVYRTLVLEAHRFGGVAALEAGIVDAVGGLDEVRQLVRARGLTTKADKGVYGLMKAEMYRESLIYLSADGHWREEEREKRWAAGEEERMAKARQRLRQLNIGFSKL